MELRQLRYFVAVAEELHFGRAARRLAISQPPLSYNIARLEQSLGYSLLNRTSRSVELTAAGRVFYREARRILGLAEEAQELGNRAARGEIGTLRIGLIGVALLTPLAAVLRGYGAERPGLRITLHELNSFEQVHALQTEQIDFGILFPRTISDELRSRAVYRERFVCAIPANHPLAGASKIRLAALKDEPFVIFPRHFSPEYHDQIIAMCMKAGFAPNVRYEVRANATIVSLVAAGFGVAIVPESMSNLRIDGLQIRPLVGPSVESELMAAWRENDYESLIRPLLTELGAADTAI